MSGARSLDAGFFNSLANHPSIRPHLGGGDGELDLSAVVESTENVCWAAPPDCGFAAVKMLDGFYEIHSMALPEARGLKAARTGFAGISYLFAATDAVELATRVPHGNRAARGLARCAGFRERFRLDHDPRFGGPVSFQYLTLEDWRARDPACLAWGQKFHDAIENAKRESGSLAPIHADDEAHDRAVGAACLMVLAGNPRKAVWSYNRWAIMAGYAAISLKSEHPIIIDVVDAIVAPRGDGIEVLSCRLEPPQPS